MEQQPKPVNSDLPIIKVSLFGAFTLMCDNRPIRLATRKIQLLLAYLILFPEPHFRDHLATLFWGDTTDEQARHSLRTALYALRRTIGDSLIRTEHALVQLNPHFPIWVDAWELRRVVRSTAQPWEELCRVLDLYGDTLLTGSYDDWVLLERERYQTLYLQGLLALTQNLRAQSKYLEAGEVARRVLDRDPLNEQACQHLIFCLIASGSRSEALQEYERFRRTLEHELGVEPTPETVRLLGWAQQSHMAEQTAARVSNLPLLLNSFIGRRQVLSQLTAVVHETRLLTLIGVGGSGKTRLAIELGTMLLKRFPDGVWWVELGVLRDEALVPQAVAKALGLREQPGEAPTQGISRFLQAKQLLLVLDNCEHLVPACSHLLGVLLSRCPHLRVVVTSRAALQLPGERVYLVPPLALPPVNDAIGSDAAARYEAVQLFVERARAVEVAFTLTPATTHAVVQLCRQLDGLPFALELAAAQLRMLTLDQLHRHLQDHLRLPGLHPHPGLPHQQTLQATMDWSYTLLSAEEQLLLCRLAVFAGRFSLEAVEHVCGSFTTPALELLIRLVNKALIVVEYDTEERCYCLLITVQQYAQERLVALGEEARLRAAHLAYYSEVAETAAELRVCLTPDQLEATWSKDTLQSEELDALTAGLNMSNTWIV